MTTQLLYKYRPLENWKFVLDIFLNKRVYAAPFHTLNDPMEGRFFYFSAPVALSAKRAIYQSKLRHNICSFSTTKRNTLLWSYYADGHKGIAIGVRISPVVLRRIKIKEMTYDSGIYIGRDALRHSPDQLALDVLTQKQLPWAHEKEVRAFSPDHFIPISISEVVLGCMIEPANEALVRKIVSRWHPSTRVTKLRREMLDNPDALGIE